MNAIYQSYYIYKFVLYIGAVSYEKKNKSDFSTSYRKEDEYWFWIVTNEFSKRVERYR